jgi:hypothetical protein
VDLGLQRNNLGGNSYGCLFEVGSWVGGLEGHPERRRSLMPGGSLYEAILWSRWTIAMRTAPARVSLAIREHRSEKAGWAVRIVGAREEVTDGCLAEAKMRSGCRNRKPFVFANSRLFENDLLD